jgi:hypothetical protein
MSTDARPNMVQATEDSARTLSEVQDSLSTHVLPRLSPEVLPARALHEPASLEDAMRLIVYLRVCREQTFAIGAILDECEGPALDLFERINHRSVKQAA